MSLFHNFVLDFVIHLLFNLLRTKKQMEKTQKRNLSTFVAKVRRMPLRASSSISISQSMLPRRSTICQSTTSLLQPASAISSVRRLISMLAMRHQVPSTGWNYSTTEVTSMTIRLTQCSTIAIRSFAYSM